MDGYELLPDSDFLLPALRQLPVHNREHWLLARHAIQALEGQTAAERYELLRSWVVVGFERAYIAQDGFDTAFCDIAAHCDAKQTLDLAQVFLAFFQQNFPDGLPKPIADSMVQADRAVQDRLIADALARAKAVKGPQTIINDALVPETLEVIQIRKT